MTIVRSSTRRSPRHVRCDASVHDPSLHDLVPPPCFHGRDRRGGVHVTIGTIDLEDAPTTRRTIVAPQFVAFSARLVDDLGLVKALVESGPSCGAPSPADLAERLYPEFAAWLDQRLAELAALAAGLTDGERETHGAYLRRELRPFTDESAFLKRTNDRPRGYAGDSEMMRMIYDPDFRGESIFGRLLHRHPVESAAAQAVRHRIGLIANVLRERKERRGGRLRVLSLACGPARELRHLVRSREEAEGLELVFVDQDEEALAEARAEIANVEEGIGAALHAGARRVSVRDILRAPLATASSLGDFDVIYTLGLFDYLAAPVARRLVAQLTDLLRRGGTLVVGNYHVDCETRPYLDLWMNWPLLYRSEAELLTLAEDGGDDLEIHVERDPTGSQMFLFATRKGR